MRMIDRIRRNRAAAGKPKIVVSISLPEHAIEDLKEVAVRRDFGSYEALIKAYISQGFRQDLLRMEAERQRDGAVEEFSQRLIARGLPRAAIEEAAAEMLTAS